jgi:hypothetical protein
MLTLVFSLTLYYAVTFKVTKIKPNYVIGATLAAPLTCHTEDFVDSYRTALAGDLSSLRGMLSSKCRISTPVVSDRTGLLTGLTEFSKFFLAPEFLVEDSCADPGRHSLSITAQLSFNYPLPWRPRVIIPTTMCITFSEDSTQVLEIDEKWEVSLSAIFYQQVLPRGWDVWHVFSSPSPEYPPVRTLARLNRVSIVELPATIMAETTWTGLAKYEGPPMLAVPGFSLFGTLSSAQARREGYHTSLPVEVLTGKFQCPSSGLTKKATTWRYHVPTALQRGVLPQATTEEVTILQGDSLLKSDPEDDEIMPPTSSTEGSAREMDHVEYLVGYENLSVMKQSSGGAVRGGGCKLTREMMEEYEAHQEVCFRYRRLPRRLVAQVSVRGEVDAGSISEAVKEIKAAVEDGVVRVQGRRVRLRRGTAEARTHTMPMRADGTVLKPQFGLQQWHIKACFDKKGEPAMAVYEMQYGLPSTTLFLDVELDEEQ